MGCKFDASRCWLSLWIEPLSEDTEPHLTHHCGSLTKLSARLEFHPTPDSLCKSLALEFRLARRCGRKKGVGFRFSFHPTSDLPSPAQTFPFTSSLVSDLSAVRRCGCDTLPGSRSAFSRRPISPSVRTGPQSSGSCAPPLLWPLRSCPAQCRSWPTADLQFAALSLSMYSPGQTRPAPCGSIIWVGKFECLSFQ